MTNPKPYVLRGLRRDTLGTLWTLREDGLWESTANGAVFPLARVDSGPYGPTRLVLVADNASDAVVAKALVAAVDELPHIGEAMTAQPTLYRGFVDDVRIVLAQQVTHSHTRPGIWDPDNRPEKANKPCLECAARGRLAVWLDGLDDPRMARRADPHAHACISCSPDGVTPGRGCGNCRRTGMDQTPCREEGHEAQCPHGCCGGPRTAALGASS